MSYYTANVRLYQAPDGSIGTTGRLLAFVVNDVVPDATVTRDGLATLGLVTLQPGGGSPVPEYPVTVIGTPTSGQIPAWNTSTHQWEPGASPSGTYLPVVPSLDTTGATDQTTAVQAALNAAAAGSGVTLPAGTVLVDDLSVPANVTLDATRTTIKARTITTAAVNLGNGSRIVGGKIDMSGATSKAGVAFGTSTGAIASAVTVTGASSGHGFSTGAATRPTLSYCNSDGAYYGVLLNSGCTDALVVGGSHLNGTANTSYEGSIYVASAIRARFVAVTVSGSAGHGVWVGSAGTADISFEGCTSRSNGTAGNDHRGFTVDSSCTRISFTSCVAESNVENGWLVTGTCSAVTFIGCIARANNTGNRAGGHGFEISSSRSRLVGCLAASQGGSAGGAGCGFYLGGGVTLSGSESFGNYTDGVRIGDTAKSVTVTGCRVKNNSQSGVGNGHGINTNAVTTITDLIITDNHCWDDQGTKTQGYGIAIGNANVNYYVVTGNIARAAENASGGLLDSGGATKSVANNLT